MKCPAKHVHLHLLCSRQHRLAGLLAFSCMSLSTAACAGVPQGMAHLFTLSLEELMDVPVVTAGRYEQPLWRAAAVISVLEGDSLRRKGYRSLAEALTEIPGLYVSQDGVGFNVGIRGIGSGQRAWGRTLKLMIDGQPVGLRFDASQMLGPELIPLAVVEKIEVVRGPASALYGADAYLGVINIITRKDLPESQIGLAAGRPKSAGTGSSWQWLASHNQGSWQTLVATSLSQVDRSGQTLPDSSPKTSQFTNPVSQNDTSRPTAGYARLTYHSQEWQHSLALHASRLDSHAEFLDFGTLNPNNRLALNQQTIAWQSDWQASTDSHYRLRLASAAGGPGRHEQLDLGSNYSYTPERDFSYRATDIGFEGQHWLGDDHNLVWGLDNSQDTEELMTVYSVDRSTGQSTLSSVDQGSQLFRNDGLYLQYQWQADHYGTSLNWRHDSHNLYGDHDSYRVGLTAQWQERLAAKLLYGTSFKAPNAFQLYAQSLYSGDILGNAALTPETATTTEAQLNWQAKDDLTLTLTAYHLSVRKLIELQPYGYNQQWANRGAENGKGLEAELHWRRGDWDVVFNHAWQDTEVTLAAPLQPTVQVPTASQPQHHLRLALDYQQGDAHYGLSGRYASARRASDANIDLMLKEVYQLPAYQVWRAYWHRQYGKQQLGLSIDNLFDHSYSEPGYGGVDIPAPPRTLWLNWEWSL